jgi:hypothetical protein
VLLLLRVLVLVLLQLLLLLLVRLVLLPLGGGETWWSWMAGCESGSPSSILPV